MTLDEAWQLYCRDWLASKPSFKMDEPNYRLYIRELIGKKALAEIKTMDINAILTKMGSHSPQTKKHVVGLVQRIYRRLIAWGVYDGPVPTNGVVLPKVDAIRMRFLTEKEASWLLHELDCRSPQFADVCRVSLNAGLRRGEIYALQVQHVNLETKLITVMDAKAGSRVASMTDALAKVLEKYVKDRRKDEYVFTQKGSTGKQLQYMNNVFKRVVDDLGLNEGITDPRHKVVFHTLRHTFASWLVQRGVPLYTAGDLMGHKSIGMTKRYAKLAPDTRKDAISLLEGSITE